MAKKHNRNNNVSQVHAAGDITLVSNPEVEEVTIEPVITPARESDVLSEEDKVMLANQCYHNINAIQLGTYSSVLSKYAVNYCNSWYFMAYNRDANKVGTILRYDMLTTDEKVRFNTYKVRLENAKRIERLKEISR